MWLIWPGGFVSVVEKETDVGNDTLTVRARDMRSLRAFCDLAGISREAALEQIETDYPFRLVAWRAEVDRAVAQMVDEIKYENFKNEAKRVRGGVFVKFLGDVWVDGLRLTPTAVQKRVRARWRELDRM